MQSRRRMNSTAASWLVSSTSTSGVVGQAGLGEPLAQHGGDGDVGADGARRAPQEGGVARLEAQAERVAGDVGPVLVDDRHHAERHPHLAGCAGRWAAPSRRPPRRRGRAAPATLRRPAAMASSRPASSRRRSTTVAVVPAASARATSVGVGGEDRLGVGHQQVGGGREGVVLRAVDAVASVAAGRLGPAAQLGDRRHGVGVGSLIAAQRRVAPRHERSASEGRTGSSTSCPTVLVGPRHRAGASSSRPTASATTAPSRPSASRAACSPATAARPTTSCGSSPPASAPTSRPSSAGPRPPTARRRASSTARRPARRARRRCSSCSSTSTGPAAPPTPAPTTTAALAIAFARGRHRPPHLRAEELKAIERWRGQLLAGAGRRHRRAAEAGRAARRPSRPPPSRRRRRSRPSRSRSSSPSSTPSSAWTRSSAR